MHLLIWLEDREQFLRPEIIDQVVLAELPSLNMNPDGTLADLVKAFMIHNPCGSHNFNSPCMVKDEETGATYCSKQFPKEFCNETTVQENGYPLYQRCNDLSTAFTKRINGQNVVIDNRWVVPYNPYLIWRYQAHINVEVCASIEVVKYMNKYIYKGPDRTCLQVQSNNDEINHHLQGHYIGSTEAAWRIFSFQMHQEYSSVESLSVHLLSNQSVYFAADMTSQKVHN